MFSRHVLKNVLPYEWTLSIIVHQYNCQSIYTAFSILSRAFEGNFLRTALTDCEQQHSVASQYQPSYSIKILVNSSCSRRKNRSICVCCCTQEIFITPHRATTLTLFYRQSVPYSIRCTSLLLRSIQLIEKSDGNVACSGSYHSYYFHHTYHNKSSEQQLFFFSSLYLRSTYSIFTLFD